MVGFHFRQKFFIIFYVPFFALSQLSNVFFQSFVDVFKLLAIGTAHSGRSITCLALLLVRLNPQRSEHFWAQLAINRCLNIATLIARPAHRSLFRWFFKYGEEGTRRAHPLRTFRHYYFGGEGFFGGQLLVFGGRGQRLVFFWRPRRLNSIGFYLHGFSQMLRGAVLFSLSDAIFFYQPVLLVGCVATWTVHV